MAHRRFFDARGCHAPDLDSPVGQPGNRLPARALVLLRRWLLADAAAEFDEGDRPIVLPGIEPSAAVEPAGPLPARRWRALAGASPRGYSAADWVALAAIASGLVISVAVSRLACDVQQEYGFLGPRDWLACVAGVLAEIPQELDPRWLLLTALTGASGLATLRWAAGRRMAGRSALIVLGLMLPAIVHFAFMTSLDHVHRTHYARYVYPGIFLWQGAMLTFAVVQWTAILPDSAALRRVPYALLVLVCALTAVRQGMPGRR